MRPKFVLTLVLVAAGAVVAAGWLAGRATAARLQAESDALRQRHGELVRLQGERRRLQDAMNDALHRAAPRAAEAANAEVPPPVEEPPVAAVPRLFPGEWMASGTWSNRGSATPPEALETVLWAAARGEIPTLAALLELDEVTRAKAADLLGRLPAKERNILGSPENLIAIATMNNIPRTEAQVAWFSETDADSATIGLLLGTTETDTAAQVVGDPAAEVLAPPPMLADQRNSKLAFLTLHRSAAGWRLLVPATAVDRMAAELSAPRR
ncbi:MAG TPA: hypothetical protein VHD61_06730 [Lacunisphaera sp.]|nr:hypothetical protein [Lacunisphaera sp.]